MSRLEDLQPQTAVRGILALKGERQRLLQLYRNQGLDALLAELAK